MTALLSPDDLAQAHGSVMRRIGYRREEAEDIVQEAYVRTYEVSLSTTIRQPRSYFFRVIRSLIAKTAVADQRRRQVEREYALDMEVSALPAIVVPRSRRPATNWPGAPKPPAACRKRGHDLTAPGNVAFSRDGYYRCMPCERASRKRRA